MNGLAYLTTTCSTQMRVKASLHESLKSRFNCDFVNHFYIATDDNISRRHGRLCKRHFVKSTHYRRHFYNKRHFYKKTYFSRQTPISSKKAAMKDYALKHKYRYLARPNKIIYKCKKGACHSKLDRFSHCARLSSKQASLS